MDIISGKPLIEYPCRWEYRVIGSDDVLVRASIVAVIGDLEHSLQPGNRKGKYLSLSLELTVETEDHRDRIHRELCAQDAIRMVL